MKKQVLVFCAVLAFASAGMATVSVSSPANGATVGSPAHFVASSTSSHPVTAMAIYVDNNLAYKVSAGSLNTYLTLGLGGHNVVVQSWDSAGVVQKTAESITVSVTAAPPPPSGSGAVSVSSPASGATVGSPVHFVASASAPNPITAMMIYVDNASVYTAQAGSLNTYLTIGAGSHYVVTQAWDTTGAVYKDARNITVSGSAPTPTPAPAPAPTVGTAISNIDQMTGWQNCTVCAGAGGNGPSASFSMTQFVTSPSMDGQSAHFWIGGSTPYSDALWWKQLGAQSGATHFIYDVYFYYKNANAPQALEFDVNQSVGGIKYIFGTQCDIKGSHQWDVWDGADKRWTPTGIACPAPPTYTWNHLTLEFYRSAVNQGTFVSVTLNGVKSYINRTYKQIPSGASELNIAFQMDGNGSQQAYDVWLDKASLRYW